jgi:hypothetical protein
LTTKCLGNQNKFADNIKKKTSKNPHGGCATAGRAVEEATAQLELRRFDQHRDAVIIGDRCCRKPLPSLRAVLP